MQISISIKTLKFQSYFQSHLHNVACLNLYSLDHDIEYKIMIILPSIPKAQLKQKRY